MEHLPVGKTISELETFFSSRSELLDYLILEIIDQEDTVVGSLALKIELDQLGFCVATATIGRSLKMLDTRGFTRPVSNKGRVLTARGRTELAHIRSRLERLILSTEIVDSVEINHFDDLLNVLHTRLLIEREAVRLAVDNATEKDLNQLDEVLDQHRKLLDKKMDDSHAGLDFHTLLVDAAKNRFMSAVERLLAYEEHQIESRFETLSVRKHALEYIGVHEQILAAIRARDAQIACSLMEDHISQIIALVKLEKEQQI